MVGWFIRRTKFLWFNLLACLQQLGVVIYIERRLTLRKYGLELVIQNLDLINHTVSSLEKAISHIQQYMLFPRVKWRKVGNLNLLTLFYQQKNSSLVCNKTKLNTAFLALELNVDNQRKLFKIQRQRHCFYIPEVVGILPNDATELSLRYAAEKSKLSF